MTRLCSTVAGRTGAQEWGGDLSRFSQVGGEGGVVNIFDSPGVEEPAHLYNNCSLGCRSVS